MTTPDEHLARLTALRQERDAAQAALDAVDARISVEAHAASRVRVSARRIAAATGWSTSWVHAHYLGGRVREWDQRAAESSCPTS